MTLRSTTVVCLAAMAFVVPSEFALGSVTITGFGGSFSNPVLSGVVLNPDGTETALDNSATAEYQFEAGGLIVRWGNITPAPGFTTSALGFLPAGAPAGPVSEGDQFLLGTLLFANGNSELDKLIFGIDLTITATVAVGDELVEDLELDVDIFTTLNFPSDPAWSADFIEVSGLGLASDVSVHAFENAPDVLAVELYGGIIGDPMLAAAVFQLAPGQGANGFLGSGALQAPIPEPSTVFVWTLLGVCATGGAASKARRSRAA